MVHQCVTIEIERLVREIDGYERLIRYLKMEAAENTKGILKRHYQDEIARCDDILTKKIQLLLILKGY
jgi:hypothetical protein